MTRKPIVAGMFYEENAEELENQIKESFLSRFGPGKLHSGKREGKIIGVIAPHAGYQFSGAGQAWCYKAIGESEFADVYVILGTSHTGAKGACLLVEDFETPLGIVKVDADFCRALIAKGAGAENKAAHRHEHSIEVQLPFLQSVSKDNIEKLRIVPIVIGEGTDYERFANAVLNTAKQMGKKICVICSSDFTHYGANYAYLPFAGNVKEKMKELDMGAVKWIEKLDRWSFLNYLKETGATICGRYAIAAFIEVCKGLGAKKIKVESYYTSGDVTDDYGNAVGYGSIVAE